MRQEGSGPILVTGAHRSGTNWVGRMLEFAKDLHYVHEPFNPDFVSDWFGVSLPCWYLQVGDRNGHKYAPGLDNLFALKYPLELGHLTSGSLANRARHAWEYLRCLSARYLRKRPLVKDPIALFSAPYISQNYGASVVIMIRHPAAFASSLLRLNWSFDFGNLLRQPALMDGMLEPYAEEIEEYSHRPKPLLEQACLFWRIAYGSLPELKSQLKRVVVLRHEDLSANPLAGFRTLYEDLGIAFPPRIERKILAFSSPDNPVDAPMNRVGMVRRASAAVRRVWTVRLSDDQISFVRRNTQPEAALYYSEDDWFK